VIESKAKLIAKVAEPLKISFDPASVRDIAAEIEWRKYSMLSLEEYAEVASTRPNVAGLSVQKNIELQTAYEEAKAQANRLDWEDVLILALGLLRAEPRAVAHVRTQYRFFTVDEYQDISPLQHALLDEWMGDHDDLCVVGDPNQTIYSFTGATSAFLSGFSDRFDDATVVQLTRNYRSTQEIVAFANRLTHGVSSLHPLESQNPKGLAPLVRKLATVADEAASIANAIADKLAQGCEAQSVAVLYRVNSQSEPIENALTKLGIEYQVRGGERFFGRKDVQQAVQAIRVEAISNNEKPVYQAVSDILRSLGWQSQEPNEKGAALEKWQALSALLQIVDEVPEAITLSDFAKELEERQRSQHEPQRSAVTLATIHAAKGLEWDHVYLAGASEGYIPISYAKSPVEIAEERRLLYVAVTRAGKELTISWPEAESAGGRTREPSRFLARLTN
jgi:DNA helicase-2/ATP-dependent DNA helicase PcrA